MSVSGLRVYWLLTGVFFETIYGKSLRKPVLLRLESHHAPCSLNSLPDSLNLNTERLGFTPKRQEPQTLQPSTPKIPSPPSSRFWVLYVSGFKVSASLRVEDLKVFT